MESLTARQSRFVDEYSVDGNGARAAVAAGYSPKTAKVIASQNLTKLNIAQAVAEKQREVQADLELTRDMAIRTLWSIATGPNTKDSVRVQAIWNVARIMGWVTNKHEVRGEVVHVSDQMSHLTDEELDAIIEAGKQARLEAGQVIEEQIISRSTDLSS